ncbi:MAG TPA: SUMF1/EgtB/PvdO family nonheme iron enzyme [Gammaproteobacteria bacterium]|nr:SUMF1/EgtB/PvdO family nonheme iron enzyme [Gammaproteobacteria bacterium]
MRAAKKDKIAKEILHDLVPLNALSESRFGKIAEKIVVEEVRSGHYLFRKGDRDGKSVYLLEGRINLIDGFRKVTGEVEAGTDMARYPIANLQPRALSARAAKKSVIAHIDSNLLDVFLACDQTQTADVVEISGEDAGDWMTRVLQSQVFSRLPPAKIQSLLMKMKPFSLKAGETVIKQGDEGDYFYTIHEGRCAVTRRDTPESGEVQLAELGAGDSFGEDALVSNTLRNATVTMLTDGTLMRLAKQDFVELLKKQLVKHIDRNTAHAMVEEGAVWLDVRTPDEHARGSFDDSVNIPLSSLRDEMSELVFNATYILYCDTGGRSGSAAFMLSHTGFDVYVLEGGTAALTAEELDSAGMSLQHGAVDRESESAAESAEADIISLETARRAPGAGENDIHETAAAGMDEGNSGVTPEQEQLRAELQHEKAALLAEIENYRDTEQRLTEQLELLRAELGESGEKLGVLYAQAKSDAEEKQTLREQYDALREELNEQQQVHKAKQDETSRRIDDLQSQLDSVRQESLAGSDAANSELGELQASNARLSEELAAATGKAEALEAQYASAMEAESRRAEEAANALQGQQEYVQQLQGELERLGEANAQLQEGLAADSEQEQSVSNELRGRLQEMDNRLEGLSTEIDVARDELGRKDADLLAESARVRELDQANQELLASLEAARQSITQLQAESGGSLQEQQARAEELRAELAGTLDANEQLKRELEEAVSDRIRAQEELQSRLEQTGDKATRADEELAELRHQLDVAAESLAYEKEHSETLQQQNNDQTRELESLRAEIGAAKDEGESIAATASEVQQELENQLGELRNELAGVTEQSREAASRMESAADTIQALEQEKESLNAALQEAESRLSDQAGRLASLESENQEAISSLSRQVEEYEAQRNALDEQLGSAQQDTEQLRTELESRMAEFNAEKKQLEEEHEARIAVLQQEKEAGDAALSALQAEHHERYVAELEERDRKLSEVQVSFQASQEEIEALRQIIEEHNTQLESLQLEISEREENRRLIEEQLESSREQNNQLKLGMQQYEEHARQAEEEFQTSIRKAHDDLTRKNENERELQGQIDRLRKQLEQSTLDQHKQRETAQDDLDNIREQLHAERRERAEERAEMAARQRELKEQLASIATEHEANLGRRSGALEEARDAIRAEEQERVRAVLEAQAQTEDQIQKLQQELYKAHEEISELNRQQRSVRQVDVELLQEQNQQAVSTIAQLESQLKQLSEERDSVLEEQTGLRDRVNALRGEVEVARGLMNLHGQDQAENPVRLRSELEEAKKNVEIAVRLRAEAETARDRLLRERDQLRSRLEPGDGKSSQLHIPVLDRQSKYTPDKAVYASGGDKPRIAGNGSLAVPPNVQEQAGGAASGSRKRWSAAVIGLGISGAVALAVWLMLGSENPLLPASLVELTAEHEPASHAEQVPEETVSDIGMQAPARQAETRAASTPRASQKNVVEDSEPAVARVAAVRSFRDALAGGVKGPVMMELPAATYKMGSLGNSLNFDESPRHAVSLPGFSISKYEVTFAEYDRFARATGRRLPYDENWGRGNRPVINVSWKDAVAYTEWLSRQSGKSYRLPTEAEWEYAVRAGGGSRHWWDDEAEGVYANCFNCGSDWDNRQTSPVGSFPANRFGLHDMAGNVQEWTQDCYQTGYTDAPADGSALLIPECTQRTVRGGGYTSPLDTLRSARRGQYDQDTRLDNIGFRVVRNN